MSPLTKALVLLVTILSIILVALVVPFVARTDDLNSTIKGLQTQVSVAGAAAAKAEQDKATLQAQLSNDDKSNLKEMENLRSERERLTQTVNTLESQVKESSTQSTKLGTTITIMQQTQDQLTNLLQNRTEALTESQSGNVELKKQGAQLSQANDDLDAQVNGLSRTVRLLNEKVVDLQEQLAGTGGSGGGGTEVTSIPSGQEIRGSITGIQSVDDITLIQLNVGANDSVSPNTRFVIFRNGDQFVGTATIKSVDETVSVAKVDSAKGAIRVGDNAMSGLRY